MNAHALSDTYRAEWSQLARPRTIGWSLLGAVTFAGLVTAVLLLGGDGLWAASSAVLERHDGAVRSVTQGLVFASIPVFSLFVALPAGDIARGTWRTALLHQPRRLTLAVGQLLARWAFAAGVAVVAVLAGWLVAVTLAPGVGIDTSAWFGADGLRAVAALGIRLVLYVGGWALLGTLVGVVCRSVPVGLGVGLLWAGPLENIIGDELAFAPTWFPGLLLRGVLSPAESPVAQSRIAWTLGAYALVALAVIAVTVRRRDATG